MGQKNTIATLGIELEMVTSGAKAKVDEFGGAFDKMTASVIREASAIDAAMQGITGMDAVTASAVQADAQIRKAASSSRDAAAAVRERNAAEKQGEGVVARLEREAATYGKTAGEVRALKAEEAALRNDRAGNVELAERIRDAEAERYAVEYAAIRRNDQAVKAAFEDRAAAADKAGIAAEQEASAVREAAHAYQMFEAAARAGAAVMQQQEATALREAAHAWQMFEAAARNGAAALREVEAAERANDQAVHAVAVRENGVAHQMFEARVREGAAAMKAEEAAAVADAAALQRIRELLDPAAVAQDHLNKEMAEAQRVMLAAGLSGEEVARVHGLMSRQAGEVTARTGEMKQGMQQLSYQLNDVATSWSSGTPPMQIFAQQSGQLFQALGLIAQGGVAAGQGAAAAGAASEDAGVDVQGFGDQVSGVAEKATGMGGKLGAVAGFLSGPWGAAAIVAASLLVPMIAGMLDFGDATDDAVEKLKKEADEAEQARVAHERFETSVEGVAAAIRDQAHALDDAAAADRSAAERAAIAARVNLERELSIRRVTAAQLEQALAVSQDATAFSLNSTDAANAQRDADTRVASLREQLAQQNAAIATAGQNVQRTMIGVMVEVAGRVADPMARINRLYDDQAKAAKRAADAQVLAGGQVTGALAAQLAVIERNRAAAVKAEQERTSAAKETANQIGRNITLSDARGIAEGIGGRITSDHRTFAEQQALYAKYTAYKAGNGPWAALAAKPGTSNHELDQALDVAKSDGMTLKKLVDAYRAAGVKLTEALDEGSHFHVAWKSVGDQAKRETAERTAAAKAMKDALKAAQDEAARQNEYAAERIADREKFMPLGDWDKPLPLKVGLEVDLPELPDFGKQISDELSFSEDAVKQYAATFGNAFGGIGDAIGKATAALVDHGIEQRKMEKLVASGEITRTEAAKRTAIGEVGGYADITSAAKGMFSERSRIYKGLQAAETTFRAVQLAMSIAKMVQDATETVSTVANSGVRATAQATEGIAAQSKLTFPYNIAAMAATAAALVGFGVAVLGGGGGGNNLPKANDGTGTVLGSPDAKSESIQRSLDRLADLDDATLTVSRGMAASLRSIENGIGGLSTLLVRAGNINASTGVTEGFKTDAIGSLLGNSPIIGGILKGLFGTKTKVVGSGLYGGAQSVGDILSGGFDADYYSDIKKTKKVFGVSAGSKYKTQYSDADSGIEDQFTLLLRQFYETIGKAATPLGQSLDAVQSRLLGFTVDIGKIDLQGLTGDEIQEKLSAVFGAAADRMAEAAVPGLARFQKVGEGTFETLVRVSSTVEQVDAMFQRLGVTTGSMGVDIDMSIAGMFASVSDFTSATSAYYEAFYSDQERAAAETARVGKVFAGLGVAMPDTLAGFRSLVDAQDLTTAAGQQMYATLIQLAPAFAELKGALDGAASAAAIVRQREDLESQMLELRGDTAAIRAAALAKIDTSNRALQEQVWAIQDAKTAADAAKQLRDAWTSVGDSIMDEVKRIRGLNTASTGGSFATLMGQFNAATSAANAGNMDAAKGLPQLSKAVLDAAALAATSRQELDRVQGQVASVLEAVAGSIGGGTAAADPVEVAATATAAQATATASNTADMLTELRALRDEVAQLRAENNSGHAATAGNTGRLDRRMEAVTAASGGQAITITQEAAA